MKRGARTKQLLNAIRNVMDSFKVSVDAAMDALHIPEADRAKYRAMLPKLKRKLKAGCNAKQPAFA